MVTGKVEGWVEGTKRGAPASVALVQSSEENRVSKTVM